MLIVIGATVSCRYTRVTTFAAGAVHAGHICTKPVPKISAGTYDRLVFALVHALLRMFGASGCRCCMFSGHAATHGACLTDPACEFYAHMRRRCTRVTIASRLGSKSIFMLADADMGRDGGCFVAVALWIVCKDPRLPSLILFVISANYSYCHRCLLCLSKSKPSAPMASPSAAMASSSAAMASSSAAMASPSAAMASLNSEGYHTRPCGKYTAYPMLVPVSRAACHARNKLHPYRHASDLSATSSDLSAKSTVRRQLFETR